MTFLPMKWTYYLGVPQGSVVGPCLFLFYINDDLPENLLSKIRLFADDTIAYLTMKSNLDADVLQLRS